MENTSDQEHPDSKGKGEATNRPSVIADDHVNGQVTSEPNVNLASPTSDGGAVEQPRTDPVHDNAPVTVPNTMHKSSEALPSLAPLKTTGLLARRQAANPSSPEVQDMNGNIDMPDRPDDDDMQVQLEHQRTRTQTPDAEQANAAEGPLTPRNNAGPFVFDGSAGSSGGRQLVVPGIPEVTDGNGLSAL